MPYLKQDVESAQYAVSISSDFCSNMDAIISYNSTAIAMSAFSFLFITFSDLLHVRLRPPKGL